MVGSGQQQELLIADSGDPLPQQQQAPDAARGARRSIIIASLGLSVLAVLALPQSRALTSAFVKWERPTLDVYGVVSLTSASDFSDMLDAVNRERQKKSLSDLCYNEKLNKAAERHSNDMHSNQFMSHTGSDGSHMSERMSDAGYNWGSAAENVASGQTSVSQVMNSWMNSHGHRANILKDGISHFGMARKGNYWTQVFGSPLGNEACQLAGGGEDGHGGQCKDAVPKGHNQWHDSDGEGYHCDWYAQGDRCAKHGDSFKNFGFTAKEACCSCGRNAGGRSGCMDKVPDGMDEWYDSGGKNYHCIWYADDTQRCAKHGDHWANQGLTANQACCGCGGGTQLGGSPAPAASPPPASSGACCGESCQEGGDCGSNLFC